MVLISSKKVIKEVLASLIKTILGGIIMSDLSNKVALITGAASGIGHAAAISLVKSGAKVALLDLIPKNLEAVYKEIKELGGEALILEANIADPCSMSTAIDYIINKWGHLDIVFANAGINGTVSPIEHLAPEDWDKTMQINLKGTFLTIKYAVPHLKKNGGSIIITSSINGNRTYSSFGMSAYSTSKAGQVAFGKMAALELAKYKIRVNIICPGAIDTNIEENTFREEEKLKEIAIPVEYPEGSQPLAQKSGEPKQVADLVLFLSSDASSHVTGTEIYIDGAESLL